VMRLAILLGYCISLSEIACAGETAPTQSPLASPQARLLGNVAFKQRLGKQVPIDALFRSDRGERVTLRECQADRPTVLVLAYYRCPMLCNQVLNAVAQCLKGIDFEAGEDFEVVVVSFDPSDTVALAASKKAAVVDAYGKGDGDGWDFLIGNPANVAALAASVGFHYEYDPATKQYAHASGIVLLTPSGRTSRYFYGIEYPTRDVRLGLVEASQGRIGSPVDEFLLYCFHYDPLTGKYGLAIMRLVRTAGAITVATILSYVAVSLHRERRQRRAAQSVARSEGDRPSSLELA
jgi:protein SCO1